LGLRDLRQRNFCGDLGRYTFKQRGSDIPLRGTEGVGDTSVRVAYCYVAIGIVQCRGFLAQRSRRFSVICGGTGGRDWSAKNPLQNAWNSGRIPDSVNQEQLGPYCQGGILVGIVLTDVPLPIRVSVKIGLSFSTNLCPSQSAMTEKYAPNGLSLRLRSVSDRKDLCAHIFHVFSF
jgi:hypothetical protein